MKFNNKLKLPQYIKLVDEIVEGYFEQTTGEYVPHIGEIHMAYLYFKNCSYWRNSHGVSVLQKLRNRRRR